MKKNELTIGATYTDTRTGKQYTYIGVHELKNDDGTTTSYHTFTANGAFLRLTLDSPVLEKITDKIETKETIKVNKNKNAEEMLRIHDYIARVLMDENYKGYEIIEETAKKKFIIRYTDETTKKHRNITEMFYKSRFNIIACFIREVPLTKDIDYSKSLADSNKARGYNFYIETSINTDDNSIKNYVSTIVRNHKATLTA